MSSKGDSLFYKKYIFFILLTFMTLSCSEETVEVETQHQVITELWEQNVEGLLLESLWLQRDKYDSSSILMMPMIWVFKTEDVNKIKEISEFFSQVNTYYHETLTESRISNTQFQYFISQYLILKYKYNGLNDTELELLDKVQQWTVSFWNDPAWLWGREPFDSMNERINWKLAELNPEHSYDRAIFDEELFLLATAANLQQIDSITLTEKQEYSFSQIKEIIWLMLSQEIKLSLDTSSSNHFNFQKGVWTEYRDYAYAGQSEIIDGMSKAKIHDIATDSSHMHRWPVWLKSFKQMFLHDENKLQLIMKLEMALALQFNNYVYVKSDNIFPAPRMNNFFDGRNGVYRYLYETQGDSGYGPYQLSGTLAVGWYGALLSADSFAKDILKMLNQGQLPAHVISTYVGPNTTRDKHPLFKWPDYFNNGLAELNFRITYDLLSNHNVHASSGN